MLFDKSPMNLVVPANHPLAQKTEVSLADLFFEDFIPNCPVNTKPGVGFGQNNVMMSSFFSSMVPQTATDMHSKLLSIEANLGVGFFPEAYKKYISSQKVCFLTIKEPIPPVSMYIVWKKGADNYTLESFIDVIRKQRGRAALDDARSGERREEEPL